jgi:hypothetical protein
MGTSPELEPGLVHEQSEGKDGDHQDKREPRSGSCFTSWSRDPGAWFNPGRDGSEMLPLRPPKSDAEITAGRGEGAPSSPDAVRERPLPGRKSNASSIRWTGGKLFTGSSIVPSALSRWHEEPCDGPECNQSGERINGSLVPRRQLHRHEHESHIRDQNNYERATNAEQRHQASGKLGKKSPALAAPGQVLPDRRLQLRSGRSQ